MWKSGFAALVVFWCLPAAAQDSPELEGFVRVRAGETLLGSPEEEAEHQPDERQHATTISGDVWIQATEVTQAQWRAMMFNNPSHHTGCDDCPVEQVSWWDAVAFCNALSRRANLPVCYALRGCTSAPGEEGFRCEELTSVGVACQGYRLPTEAEWEVAVRAGSMAERYGALDQIAWHPGNADVTHDVAQREPNALGLHDLLGNVWEWCGDWYGAYPTEAVTDPTGPESGRRRVLRGGGITGEVDQVRAAFRGDADPSHESPGLGFRVARSVQGDAGLSPIESSESVVLLGEPLHYYQEELTCRGDYLVSSTRIDRRWELLLAEGSLDLDEWVAARVDEFLEGYRGRELELWRHYGPAIGFNRELAVSGHFTGERVDCGEVIPSFAAEAILGFHAEGTLERRLVIPQRVPVEPNLAITLIESARAGHIETVDAELEGIEDLGGPQPSWILHPFDVKVFHRYDPPSLAPTERRVTEHLLHRWEVSRIEDLDERQASALDEEVYETLSFNPPPVRGHFSGELRMMRSTNADGLPYLVVAPVFVVTEVRWP